MRYKFLLGLFIIVIGCKEKTNPTEDNTETRTELQKKIKKTDLPNEVIQANVSFLSSPIKS